MTNILNVEHLEKTYKSGEKELKVLDDISFSIREGETFAQVTNELYQRGIIPSEFNFKVAGFIYGAEKKIKAAKP